MRVRYVLCCLAGLATPLGAQTLRSPLSLKDAKASVEVYADGNLKNALGGENTGPIAAASLGLGIGIGQFSFDLLVNTIGTASALRKDFGNTLLAPASGTSLAAGLVDVRWFAGNKPSDRVPASGIRAYGSISSARWQVDTTLSETTGVVVGGAGMGGFLTLRGHVDADAGKKSNGVSALLDVGLAVRAIGGDIASAGNQTKLDAAIGGSKFRMGFELGLQLSINGAKAGLTYYYFGGDVAGLSRGQVVAGFAVQSALFSGELKAGN